MIKIVRQNNKIVQIPLCCDKIRSMKKKFISIILILLLILSAGCGNKNSESQIVLTTGFENGELFFIGDSKCYLPEALIYIRSLENSYESLYGEDLLDRKTGDMLVSDRLSDIALSRLAEVKALGLLASERGVSLTEDENEKCSQAAAGCLKSLSDNNISDIDVSLELLVSMYRDYALADKVYSDITGDIDPEISDDEARIVTIQRILINKDSESEAMETANSVYAKLNEGTSFESLADDYNAGAETKFSFGKDTDEFSPEFVNACFELSTGDVSSPLVTKEGVSIVKCLSSYDMEETDANKIRMVEKKKSEAFDEIYSAFVKDLHTGFNNELWSEQKPVSSQPVIKDNFFSVYNDIFK